jgi:hypothetical protein
MNGEPQPTKGEFIAYWERHEKERSSWRGLLPHAIFIGGLAVYALALRRLDTDGRFWIISIVIAIAYIIGLPWVWIVTTQRRNTRFIRCTKCGDWLGRDASGDWFGPNPNWKLVGETGKCTKCGAQLLAQD